MAINNTSQGASIIAVSVFLAMILMLIPLPDTARLFRPELIALVLIYWTMALPHQVGVGYAWFVGLIMDFVMGGVLGVFAFSYAFIVYLALVFHLQLRQYPMWQQAISVGVAILILQLLLIVITPRLFDSYFWLPAIVSAALWPFVYQSLRFVRRTFNVT